MTDRSTIGRRSRAKGSAFEREIARRLRAVLDDPLVLAEIEAADSHTRAAAMALSCVRRGEQSRGEREPDIVTPTRWWIELGTGSTIRPATKFVQADLASDDERPCPVAICRHGRQITATVWAHDVFDGAPSGYMITMGLGDWLRLVEEGA